MSPTLQLQSDALRDPTSTLKNLFRTLNNLDEFSAQVFAHFSAILDVADVLTEIPTLDVRNPPDIYQNRSLVRFRAMIQDTSQSPELYLAKLNNGECGGWGLNEIGMAEDTSDLEKFEHMKDCSTLWAVSVPGETSWCSGMLDGTSLGSKSSSYSPERRYKFPLPEAPHIGLQLKIYLNAFAEKLKSTDMLTFVGILSSEPLISEEEPVREVPTLHVLFAKPLPPSLLTFEFPAACLVTRLRDDLIAWIADSALAGDRTAAEWILLVLVARVHSRSPQIFPPSLAVSRLPGPPDPCALPTLSCVFAKLLALEATIPLSLDLLNNTVFSPRSIGDDLHSGRLQLPSGTTVLVTEHGMTEGHLNATGVANLQAIQDAMTAQTVVYQFPFSQYSFPTDLRFIVLCDGEKSTCFQTSFVVPLSTGQTMPAHAFYKTEEELSIPSIERLSQFRALIGGGRCGNIVVGEALSAHIQEEFVRERQANVRIAPEDLIRRMQIARLISLSMHQELTIDAWERAKLLDVTRLRQL